ncbi:hypothetical protein SLS55_009983 [Diplodia seriata]|uniref:Uncharacterized protein n=1 Tax=Diplodia seriata TaxID=420778 RepID=A0ABR3C1J9_9PEZI
MSSQSANATDATTPASPTNAASPTHATNPDSERQLQNSNFDFQTLYDVMDLQPEDRAVFDTFREVLYDKLLRASNGDESPSNTSSARLANPSSVENVYDDISFTNGAISYEFEDMTNENENENENQPSQVDDGNDGNDDNEPPLPPAHDSSDAPPPNSWANVKPGPSYGTLHFPGHAHYTPNEIPITGSHGFMLLHRRPRFHPRGQHLRSRDGQPLDQSAMLTLHYIDNSELRIQTHTYTKPRSAADLDFSAASTANRLESWVRRFLADHGVVSTQRNKQGAAAPIVPYLPEERAWIKRLFELQPATPLSELCRRFNAYWAGRIVPGVGGEGGARPRPARTNGALMNEVYRSGLKRKMEYQLGKGGEGGKKKKTEAKTKGKAKARGRGGRWEREAESEEVEREGDGQKEDGQQKGDEQHDVEDAEGDRLDDYMSCSFEL